MLRELNVNEMSMVSGGQNSEVVVEGQIIPDAPNNYEGGLGGFGLGGGLGDLGGGWGIGGDGGIDASPQGVDPIETPKKEDEEETPSTMQQLADEFECGFLSSCTNDGILSQDTRDSIANQFPENMK